MKKIFKILALLIILVLASCVTEEIESNSKASLYKSQKITFEKFMQQTGLKTFDSIINIKGNIRGLQARSADGSYELNDFYIDTDVINSIEYLNKTTYTFEVEPLDYDGTNLFNMIFYKKNNVWEKTIVEMKPTPENLASLQNGTTNIFEGQL